MSSGLAHRGCRSRQFYLLIVLLCGGVLVRNGMKSVGGGFLFVLQKFLEFITGIWVS